MKSKLIAYSTLALVIFSACTKEKKENNNEGGSTNAFTAKIDGASFQSSDVAAIVNNTTGSFLMTAEDNQDNSVMISAPTEVGTFTSTSNSKTSGIYFKSDGANWMSGLGGTATVTISKFDAATKKMSGTFSFTAAASGASGATGSKTVTDGSFTNVTFVQP